MKLTSSSATDNTYHPQTSETARSGFSDSSCGEKSDHKILVTYASEFGTTSDVAKVIGEVLCESGAQVDIKRINNVKDLNPYDAIVIGSAIQYDKWMPDAINFVTTHQNSLSKLPVAGFFTCLPLSRQTEKNQASGYDLCRQITYITPTDKVDSCWTFCRCAGL